jgi:hypothetical protein
MNDTRLPKGSIGVAKAVKLKSPEAQTDGAKKAIKKERDQMKSKGVYDENKPVGSAKIREIHPDALFTDLLLKLFIKDFDDDGSKKWKARACANGAWIWDTYGYQTKAVDDDMYNSPVNFRAFRTTMMMAHLRKWCTRQGDVAGAYLEAELKGPPVFIRLPQQLRPETPAWKNTQDPFVKLVKALYGLQRSGFDWAAKLENALKELGYHKSQTEDGVFYNAEATIVVYVDDLVLCTTRNIAEKAKKDLEHIFPVEFEEMGKFLGVRCHEKFDKATGMTTVRWEQVHYSKHLIDEFEATQGVVYKSASPDTRDPAPQPNDDQPGVLDGRKWVGALLYLSRCTRWDIAHAVGMLARKASKWTKAEDKALVRLMGYIKWTMENGLEWTINPRDFDENELVLHMHTDSDHAGEVETSKSTTGFVIALRGRYGTRAILDWGSKRQTHVARSSGQAEMQALVDGLTMSMLIEELAPDLAFKKYVQVDNDAARLGLGNYRTSAMRIMAKTHRVNLAWLHEMVYTTKIFELGRVDTKSNWANFLTKSEHPGEFVRQTQMVRQLSLGA